MSNETLKLIKDNEARWVDLRFTDTRGKEQHVTIPSKEVSEDFFEGGKMFDGSSIAGWKGINESDMILMPDDSTSILDPFTDEATVILRCDIVEPTTMQGYERDPRSVAKRAEEYLKSTGLGDTAFFGNEPEFFVFDDVKWHADMSGAGYTIRSEEAAWASNHTFDEGNIGHRPGVKGGYFPVPPVDSLHDIRAAMCAAMEQMGLDIEVHHHEVGTAGQCEIGVRFNTLVTKGRRNANPQVLRTQCSPRLWQNGHIHAQATGWRQRFRHALSPVHRQRKEKRVCWRQLCRPV